MSSAVSRGTLGSSLIRANGPLFRPSISTTGEWPGASASGYNRCSVPVRFRGRVPWHFRLCAASARIAEPRLSTQPRSAGATRERLLFKQLLLQIHIIGCKRRGALFRRAPSFQPPEIGRFSFGEAFG